MPCRCSVWPATPGRPSAFTAARTSGIGGIGGKTLTFTAFNGGTAVNVTFGDGTNGTVKTLDQLNSQLQANNLSATIDANGQAHHHRIQRLGVLDDWLDGGWRCDRRYADRSADVRDGFHAGRRMHVAQSARANLVSQYNNILNQIDPHLGGLLVQRCQSA